MKTRMFFLAVVYSSFFVSHLIAQSQIVPQTAVGGSQSGDLYLTTLVLQNPTSEDLSGTGELFDKNGMPWLVSAAGDPPASKFNWRVTAGRTQYLLLSSPRENIETGWVKITPARVNVYAVFQLFKGRTLTSQAAVFASAALTASTIAYDTRGPNRDTGIAISNPNLQTNVVRFTLFSKTGGQLGFVDQTLLQNGHFSGFLSSLFAAIPNAAEMEGSVTVVGTLPFSAVTLIFDGAEFSTLPALPGACSEPRRPIVLNEFATGTEEWIIQSPSTACVTSVLARDGKLRIELPDGNCAAIVSAGFATYDLSRCDEIRFLVRSDKDVIIAPFTQSPPNFSFRDGAAADQCVRAGEPFVEVRILKSSISDPAAANAYGIQIRPRRAGSGAATVEIERVVCVAYPLDPGQPQTQYLPQIAVGGTASANSMKTRLILLNNSTIPVSGTADIFDDAGRPLTVSVTELGSRSTFSWDLGACGMLSLELTSGAASIQSGWIRISQPTGPPVGAAVVFELATAGTLVSQAGVLSSPPLHSATLVHDSIGPKRDTGIALLNPNELTATYLLTLISETGQQLATVNETVPPNGHFAKFASQIFSNVPSAAEMQGLITIKGELSFSSTTLRFDETEFTALPVIRGACGSGFVPTLVKAVVLTGFDDETYTNIPVHKNAPSCTPLNTWFDYCRFFSRYGFEPPCAFYGREIGKADIEYTLDQLKAQFPALEWVAVLVSWFQSDLFRVNDIRPRYEWTSETGFNVPWSVAGLTRETAQETEGPIGGTPSDKGFLWLCGELKRRGYKVAVYPFVRINERCGDPKNCPPEKWRGEIIPQDTGEIETDVGGWFDMPWGYKNFQKHYATLLVRGGILPDAFLIGGELIGVTNASIDTSPPRFPGVQKLKELAGELRSIVGSTTIITYAADWGEYHHNSRFKTGGELSQLSPELERPLYHLDPLWADENIDVVGIDFYFPLTEFHTTDLDAIKRGYVSGRYFDWDPQSGPDVRISQSVAIKNLKWWWENEHFNVNPNGSRTKTEWRAKMKPIWLTEIGYASVNATTVEPYIFPPRLARGSTGQADFAIQCLAYQAFNESLGRDEYLQRWFAWNYDARPFPAFPNCSEIWQDAREWEKGHWIQGKWIGLPGCGMPMQ